MIVVAGALACAAAVWLTAAAALAPTLPRARWSHPEAERLRDAGWPWPAWRWEALRWCGVGAAAVLGAQVGWGTAGALAVALTAPSLALHLRAGAVRERRRRAALAHFRTIGAALASGAGLIEAIRRAVAAEADPVAARALARALESFTMGASLSDGLRAAATTAHPRSRPALLTLALGVEERLPAARLSALVESVVERLGFEEQVELEVRARTSGARVQIWIMAAVVPLLGLYLVATVPLVADVISSDLGRRLLVPAALALELGGILLSRSVIRDVGA